MNECRDQEYYMVGERVRVPKKLKKINFMYLSGKDNKYWYCIFSSAIWKLFLRRLYLPCQLQYNVLCWRLPQRYTSVYDWQCLCTVYS